MSSVDQNQPLRDVLALLTATQTDPTGTSPASQAATAHMQTDTRLHLCKMIGSAVGIIHALTLAHPDTQDTIRQLAYSAAQPTKDPT